MGMLSPVLYTAICPLAATGGVGRRSARAPTTMRKASPIERARRTATEEGYASLEDVGAGIARAIRSMSQSREEGPVTSPCPPCALRRWLPSRNDPVLVPTRVIGRLGDSVSVTLARARGESGRLRVWWLCTLATIILLVSVVSIPARAASPSSGAGSQSSPSLTGNGPCYVVAT